MHTRSLVTLFLLGLLVGYLVRAIEPKRTLPAPSHDVPLRITELADPGTSQTPKAVQVVPFRVIEDGHIRDFDVPRLQRVWVLSIDDGRLQIYGTSAN